MVAGGDGLESEAGIIWFDQRFGLSRPRVDRKDFAVGGRQYQTVAHHQGWRSEVATRFFSIAFEGHFPEELAVRRRSAGQADSHRVEQALAAGYGHRAHEALNGRRATQSNILGSL